MSLEISSIGSVFMEGEEVDIRVTMKNTSTQALPFGHSDLARFDYALEVVRADGNSAPRSKSAQRRAIDVSSGSPPHWISGNILPGTEISEVFDMDDFFDVTAPGAYSIQALWPPKSSSPMLRSNVLLISVQPAPPTYIRDQKEVLESAKRFYPKETKSPLSLMIHIDKAVVASGKPVDIWYQLTNTANRVIRSSPGTSTEYAVEARDEFGAVVPDTGLNAKRRERIEREDADPDGPPAMAATSMVLGPGQQSLGVIDAARFVDLFKPGIYSIQLWRRLPEDAGGSEIRSNVIVVTIGSKLQ